MRRKVLWSGVLLLVFVPALAALDDKKDPAPPKEQYDTLLKEYQTAQKDFSKAYQAAKTDEERRKAIEQMPNPQKLAPRFLEIAEKNPKDPVAVDALVWVVTNGRGGKEVEQAVDLPGKDHVSSPRLGPLCQSLSRSPTPGAEKLLRAILEKNPDKDVQGMACFALAQNLKYRSEQAQRGKMPGADQLAKQAEELF